MPELDAAPADSGVTRGSTISDVSLAGKTQKSERRADAFITELQREAAGVAPLCVQKAFEEINVVQKESFMCTRSF